MEKDWGFGGGRMGDGTEQRLEVRSQGAKAWGLVVLAELDMLSVS